jgi:chromate transporter
MTGAGMIQALPGPIFCFSTFVNAMAMASEGSAGIILGGFIGTIGIFLPGALLIFFLLPLWDRLKTYNRFNKAIEGINAASAGLVISAVFILSSNLTFDASHVMVVLGTILLLSIEKIPSPFIVMGCILCGILISV